MAAYKTGAFVRSKYYTPLKWIPCSKSGASKSRPCWAAHTRIGNVWEYPPPPKFRSICMRKTTFAIHSRFYSFLNPGNSQLVT